MRGWGGRYEKKTVDKKRWKMSFLFGGNKVNLLHNFWARNTMTYCNVFREICEILREMVDKEGESIEWSFRSVKYYKVDNMLFLSVTING